MNQARINLSFVSVVLCLLVSSGFRAVAQVGPDPFSLSFDELLEQQVTLSSKSAVALDMSPSTVTVFTRQMLDRMAVDNLYDVLNYVPGFQVTRGDWVGAVSKEHARGVFLDNGYVLFMIDGQRINEISFGKASVYTPYISVDLAQRIEIIRGPGSALYGSNAFMGVVNLITRKQEKMIKASTGSRGDKKISAGYHGLLEDEGNWHLLLDYRDKAGASHQYQGQKVTDPKTDWYIQAGLETEHWQARARANQSQMDGFINLGGASDNNRYQSENLALSVRYQWWQRTDSQVQSSFEFSEHRIASSGLVVSANDMLSNDFFTGPNWITRNWLFSTDWVQQLGDSAELSAGVNLLKAEQTQAGTLTTHITEDNSDFLLEDRAYQGGIITFSRIGVFSELIASQDAETAYAQIKWQPKENLTLYTGMRYDNIERLSPNWSPRFSLIYQSSAQQSWRLQYGQAFRSPTTNELFSRDSVTVGNPQLQQEKIETIEGIWRWQSQQSQLEVVYFHNSMDDFVDKIPAQGQAQFTFANTQSHRIRGLEISANIRFSERFESKAALTQLFDAPFNDSYKRYANFGIGYQHDPWSVNMDGLWRGRIDSENGFSQGSVLLVNARINWQIKNNSSVFLQVSNLFDREYNTFEPRVAGQAMPGEQPRLSLGYQYIF